uniref:Uncharacterized protein n=1 Tax=Acrobeloides nanus TaxID=290746 RepID=A0A914CTB3_9BILA
MSTGNSVIVCIQGCHTSMRNEWSVRRLPGNMREFVPPLDSGDVRHVQEDIVCKSLPVGLGNWLPVVANGLNHPTMKF